MFSKICSKLFGKLIEPDTCKIPSALAEELLDCIHDPILLAPILEGLEDKIKDITGEHVEAWVFKNKVYFLDTLLGGHNRVRYVFDLRKSTFHLVDKPIEECDQEAARNLQEFKKIIINAIEKARMPFSTDY